MELWRPGHPVAHADGYAPEHRLVAYEAGLLTDLTCDVHHGPGGKQDNRLSNLTVMRPAAHTRLHHLHEEETYHRRCLRIRAELGERACEVCGAGITSKRIDATVCGNTCRVTRWKRANRPRCP